MKRWIALPLLAAALAGCGAGSHTDAPTAAQSPSDSLQDAIQGYMDAWLSGDALGAASYFETCSTPPVALRSSAFSKSAGGARVVVTAVHTTADGQHGGATAYRVDGGSAAFKRMWDQAVASSPNKDSWIRTASGWSFAGDCEAR